jgi:hypothetical protein
MPCHSPLHMVFEEHIKTPAQLLDVADMLRDNIRGDTGDVVSRCTHTATSTTRFIEGRTTLSQNAYDSLNKEHMSAGIFSATGVHSLNRHNAPLVTVARDYHDRRIDLYRKGVPLPTEQMIVGATIPSAYEHYDEELRQFTETHPDTKIDRTVSLEQQVIVNSHGGVAIQTRPSFQISYEHGYDPIPTSRFIRAICETDEDIKRFVSLLAYQADPTLDKRIRNAQSFTDAFHALHEISALRYGSLSEAGVPDATLFDVAVLDGVPIHEIFGHHFEEPYHHLGFGETGAFRLGQDVGNRHIVLTDDPSIRVAGFKVNGFTNFDAYGRRREARTHIKDGCVTGFLGTEYADMRGLGQYINVNTPSFVGNAVQDIENQLPQARMSCTVLDGPTIPFDLDGIILMIPEGGHTDTRDRTYCVESRECYVLKDDQPRRIIPLKMTGGILQALVNMELLEDQTYQVGFCGRRNPLDSRYPAQAGVSQFCRAQLWKRQQVSPRPLREEHLRVLVG